MSTPLQTIFGAYLYDEYQTDENLAAWWQARNQLTQGYLDWWNNTPLGVYTSPQVSGALLDWIGQGIYGIPRPVISTSSTSFLAGLNQFALNSIDLNGNQFRQSGTAQIADDDIYRRVLTWWLWRGDGPYMNVTWLKRRVMRFLSGENGSDLLLSQGPPSITVSGNVINISVPESATATIMSDFLASNILLMPFPYSASVSFYQQLTTESGSYLTTEYGSFLVTDQT